MSKILAALAALAMDTGRSAVSVVSPNKGKRRKQHFTLLRWVRSPSV